MKKIIKISIIFVLFVFVFSSNLFVRAATSYFDGEKISINKNSSLEIISNEVFIDTTTSKINNTFILQNPTKNEIKETLKLNFEQKPDENTLKVLSNGKNAKIKKIDDYSYEINVTISAEKFKKIEINYNTESDLQNAKIIKYSLENFIGKHIFKYEVKIKIKEEDIPLINAIYPYNYEFENNTIVTNIYDFDVNNLNKNVILEKETYRNLIYGDFEKNEIEEYILKNGREWINNGFSTDITDAYIQKSEVIGEKDKTEVLENEFLNKISNIKYDTENNKSYKINRNIEKIYLYALKKQVNKIDKNILVDENYTANKNTYITTPYEEFVAGKENLQKICIDFVESEQGKKLKLIVDHYGNQMGNLGAGTIMVMEEKKMDYDEAEEYYISLSETEQQKYVKAYNDKYITIEEKPEFEILKIKGAYDSYENLRIYWIGMNIDGSKIEATEEEKIEYVNKMNADFYLRKIIYDSYDGISSGGNFYYNDADKVYLEAVDVTWGKKITNKNIDKSQIPTLAYSVLYINIKEDSNLVKFTKATFGNNWGLGGEIKKVTQTSRAKSLINANKSKNEEIKNKVEKIIKTTDRYGINDVDEDFPIDKIEENKEVIQEKTNIISTEQIIFVAIIVVTAICFILFIVSILKKRGGNN